MNEIKGCHGPRVRATQMEVVGLSRDQENCGIHATLYRSQLGGLPRFNGGTSEAMTIFVVV